MKKLIIILCLFILISAALSVLPSSRAMAYDPKNDLVSAIDLKPTGLMMKKALSENKTAKEVNSSPGKNIPVNDGPSTYLDCSAPSRQDPTKETAKNFRAVFGFHFGLK